MNAPIEISVDVSSARYEAIHAAIETIHETLRRSGIPGDTRAMLELDHGRLVTCLVTPPSIESKDNEPG